MIGDPLRWVSTFEREPAVESGWRKKERITDMFMKPRCGLAFAGLLVAASATAASANPIFFDSIDTFLTENPSMLNNNVSSLGVDNVARQHDFLDMGDFTISTADVAMSVWDTPLGSAHATSGDRYIHVGGNGLYVTIDFAAPVTRFGMHITDWGDYGDGSLWYTDNLENHHTIATTPLNVGNVLFFGVESNEGITRIVLERDNFMSDGTMYDGFGMDNFYYEFAAVPAPGALALLGLAGLIGTRRRRH